MTGLTEPRSAATVLTFSAMRRRKYTATLAWIVGVLEQHGYGGVVATIQGSTPAEERELIRARFTAPPTQDPVRVLVR